MSFGLQLINQARAEMLALIVLWTRHTKTTCGGSGGNFSAIPPQAPLPPCWVIKNGALIFRGKESWNQFLRTFWGGMKGYENVSAGSPWDDGDLLFKPLIMRDSDNWKVCAQSAISAISAQILEIAQFAQFAEIASDKGEDGKVRWTPQSLCDSSPINKGAKSSQSS